jgi:glycosyltransferase involved in cell wall biosynthesis
MDRKGIWDPFMRALVLISGLATAGAERVTVNFLRHLHGTEHRVDVCTLTSRHDGPLARELEHSGVARYDLGARRLADPGAFVRLLGLLKCLRPDIIHAHGQDAAILASAARLLTSKPLVITRHVMDEPRESRRDKLRARMTLWALSRADSVIAVSKAAADGLAKITKLPRPKIHVIPNGIELESFCAAELEESGLQLREKFGYDSNHRVVLLPAALRNGKGHDVFFAAIPRLRQQIPSLRVIVAGSGDQESNLRECARSFADCVLFLGECAQMPQLFHACDLVVLPSFSEALPTALIEAAASRRPVVATRIGGTPEVVDENRTGLLVRTNDPDALADAIIEMFKNPERLKTFGSAARAHAEKNFSIELQVARTLKLWSEVIHRGGR